MNQYVSLFLKGVAMGAANVIPGVSGGTIALITGIFERLINALKSVDLQALGMIFRGRVSAFWNHVDGNFLAALLAGVVISIVTLARLFEFLLAHHEIATMAFFFGLILLSIYYVGATVGRWGTKPVLVLLLGIVIAVSIALLAPANENNSSLYLFICGVVAISSMILPGLSGSFVLIIMGNYALVLGAISGLDFQVLIPLAAGCIVGLMIFSRVLAWVFSRYHDLVIALMTGFVVGSLVTIWPWKSEVTVFISRVGKPDKEVVTGYEWFTPGLDVSTTWLAVALMVLGGLSVWLMEKVASPATTERAGQTQLMKDNYYFDNAATSWPKPEAVYRAMDDCSRRFAVNPGRAGHSLGVEAQMMLQQTRHMLAQFFNFAGPSDRVVFSPNATDSLNQLFFGLLQSGDHVITTESEHNSVLRPLNHLVRDHGVTVTHVAVDQHGLIDVNLVAAAVTPATRLLVVNHASNVTGVVQDLSALGDIARSKAIVFAIDSAQTAGVLPIDMSADAIDVLVFTGHKGLFGPMGTGGMVVDERINLVPLRMGGTGTNSIDAFQPDDYPHRLEAGTLAVPGIAGLHAAQLWFRSLGQQHGAQSDDHHSTCMAALQHIHATELEHINTIGTALSGMDKVSILGAGFALPHNRLRVATLSFVVDGLDPAAVGDMLDADNHICVRAGLHCAPLMHRALAADAAAAKTGAIRVSPGYFTLAEDVDHLIRAVAAISS